MNTSTIKINLKIKNIIALGLLILFYLLFNLNHASANHCYTVAPSCNLDGFQECNAVLIECSYGCELVSSSPGSSCPNGGDDCNGWACLGVPVYGCTDSNASNYNPSANADDGSCIYNNEPSDPEITGNDWAIVNQNSTFSIKSTDPHNYGVRYAIDYSVPPDGDPDLYLPVSGFVNSGQSLDFVHSWNLTGYQKFKVFTQNEDGYSSGLVKKELTVYGPDATLDASPENLTWGDSIGVNFDGVISPTTLDWIGLYRVEDAQEDYLDWLYASDCTKTGGTPRSSGSCIFYAPSEDGEFKFRLFANDSWSLLSTSSVVTVSHTEGDGGGGGGGPTHNVTVSVVQGPGGSVKSLDNVIDTKTCGSPCTKSYPAGSTVTLQPVPSSSFWKFTGWTGGCTGMGSCVISVNSDVVVNASFALRLFFYIES